MALEDQVIETTEEKEIPLEDTIREAIRGGSSETPEPVTPAEEPALVNVQPRAEDGTFAPKTDAPVRKTLTLPEKTAPVADLAATETAPSVIAASVKAPDGWKAEMKAVFHTLPPEVQAEINRRETEAHKAITRQDEERAFARKINEIAMPYIPTIKAEGGTVEKAVSELLQTAHVLRSGNDFQKAQNVAAVMQQFKVDPNVLFSILQGGNVQTGNPLQPLPRPQASIQPTQVAEIVQAELAKQHQIQEQRSLQSQIEAFASAPGHEHFERVKVLMGSLLDSGEATDLEDAYQQAIYAKPDIRSSLIASQTQAETDKRNAEAKAKADAARRAGGSVSGGPGSAKALNGSAAHIPIEETIRAAIRESQGRV